jgi:hypothetical protein
MPIFRKDLFASISTATSLAGFVGDAEEMTVFLDIDSETTCVLQGSNATGFREAIPEAEWSTLTTVTSINANDLLNIEPGFRWLRGIRETESAASWAALVVAGRNVTRRS